MQEIVDLVVEATDGDAKESLTALMTGRWNSSQVVEFLKNGNKPEDSFDKWWENKDEDIG